ncbi:hypothetical protein B0H13DRAFT_2529685 [Mycena leptocephala]|nr:hypothetical protein B0H13DRAFT_2529685 [Mycena leptocephala]
MKKIGKPPPSPRADPPKKKRIRSPSPVPPTKPETRSESTSLPSDDPFSADFEDLGEALLAVAKLFLNDLPKAVLDLYKDAAHQIKNISTWKDAGDDQIKGKILAAYYKADVETRDRARPLWGWAVGHLCRETRWGVGSGDRPPMKGRLFRWNEQDRRLERIGNWESISVQPWALHITDDQRTAKFEIDDQEMDCPLQYIFLIFTLLFVQRNGQKVLTEFERACQNKEPANVANMMSGKASGTRAVPAIYSQLSLNGAHGIGQSLHAARRDGQHAAGKGNRLRQAEEKRTNTSFADWFRETILEIIGDMAHPSILVFFLYLAEHICIAVTRSNSPGKGLLWNAIDGVHWEEKAPAGVIEVVWDVTILWVRQRLEMGLPAELPPSADTKFYSALAGIIGNLISPTTIYMILRGTERRKLTATFDKMPIEAYGGQYPLAMLDEEERKSQKPFDDRAPLPRPRTGIRPALVQPRIENFERIMKQTTKNRCSYGKPVARGHASTREARVNRKLDYLAERMFLSRAAAGDFASSHPFCLCEGGSGQIKCRVQRLSLINPSHKPNLQPGRVEHIEGELMCQLGGLAREGIHTRIPSSHGSTADASLRLVNSVLSADLRIATSKRNSYAGHSADRRNRLAFTSRDEFDQEDEEQQKKDQNGNPVRGLNMMPLKSTVTLSGLLNVLDSVVSEESLIISARSSYGREE